MYIKQGDEFKKFNGFIKKLADCIKIKFDNCEAKCSIDHKFKLIDNTFVEAQNLKVGDFVKNNKYSISEVFEIEKIGKHIVYTPFEVEDSIYDTDNGLINHNCSFIGSSCTLINGNILEKLERTEPIEILFNDLSLSIYSKPKPGALYVMGVDCATGVGGDYSCVQVIEIRGKNDMEQVATYRSNEVKNGEFSRVIDTINKMYNNCNFILENNDVGKTVAEELWYTLNNNNLINTDSKYLGTKADKRSKLDACMELQRVMDAGILKIHDASTIAELSIFEEVAPNVFRAAKGQHDDTVSALYWAIYATLQPEIDMDNVKAIERKKEDPDMTIDMMADANEMEDEMWLLNDFK